MTTAKFQIITRCTQTHESQTTYVCDAHRDTASDADEVRPIEPSDDVCNCEYCPQARVITRTTIAPDDSGEFVVRAYDQGNNRWPECDYYTDCRDDAGKTATEMVNAGKSVK